MPARTPFPFQEIGAQFLAHPNHTHAGIHDEMGLGKTGQIVRATDLVGATRGLVIGPAMLRQNWVNEFRGFSDRPLRLCKAVNIHDYVAWRRGLFDVLITSYELATKWAPHIQEQGEFFDFVAIDEGHYLKNVKTQRSKALFGLEANMEDCICMWSQRVWHATGTLIPNDPVDCYSFLRMCGVMPLSFDKFVKRYFHIVKTTFGSRQKVRPEMLGELQTLISNNAIRRTHGEVGLQLPPIFLTSTTVDGDTQQIATLLKQYPGLDGAIVAALEEGGLSFLDAQHVSTLRRLIGEAKSIPYAHMLADEILTYGRKYVTFGIHRDTLHNVRNILSHYGIKGVLVTGDTSERDRVAAVEAFQNDPTYQWFGGNIRAAGVGNTLTAACHLDMLESDWTPAGNAQAIKRIHRIGQAHTCHARFVQLGNSFDEVVTRIVVRKTGDIAEIEGSPMHAAPLDT